MRYQYKQVQTVLFLTVWQLESVVYNVKRSTKMTDSLLNLTKQEKRAREREKKKREGGL